jgi:orotidine-5'-phosphate decarboxylase
VTSFSERLADSIRRTGNPLCVGLDPRYESLPKSIRDRFQSKGPLQNAADACGEFCLRVIELVAGKVPVVKPQSAFFEAFGEAGFVAQRRVLHAARGHGLLTILDAKRGDIASTATAYADAAFAGSAVSGQIHPVWEADSLTINPYLGRDSVEPFLQSAARSRCGTFILVRTSNPGSGLFQNLICDGRPLYRHVAEAVVEWNRPTVGASGLGEVGAVVGATHPKELAELRRAMPDVWFLIPGYGAQGGTAADVAAGFRSDGLGGVVNSSRGITFPFHPDDPDWESKIVAATDKATFELARAAGLA